jgi:hypothetical protein
LGDLSSLGGSGSGSDLGDLSSLSGSGSGLGGLSSLGGSGSSLSSLGGLGKRQAATGLENLVGHDLGDLSDEQIAELDSTTASNDETEVDQSATSSSAAPLITAPATAAASSAAPLTTLATITRGSVFGGS